MWTSRALPGAPIYRYWPSILSAPRRKRSSSRSGATTRTPSPATARRCSIRTSPFWIFWRSTARVAALQHLSGAGAAAQASVLLYLFLTARRPREVLHHRRGDRRTGALWQGRVPWDLLLLPRTTTRRRRDRVLRASSEYALRAAGGPVHVYDHGGRRHRPRALPGVPAGPRDGQEGRETGRSVDAVFWLPQPAAGLYLPRGAGGVRQGGRYGARVRVFASRRAAQDIRPEPHRGTAGRYLASR